MAAGWRISGSGTCQEVVNLDEQYASEGLDLTRHSAKWNKAKELALQSIPNYENKHLTYWLRVLCLYSELGGE